MDMILDIVLDMILALIEGVTARSCGVPVWERGIRRWFYFCRGLHVGKRGLQGDG